MNAALSRGFVYEPPEYDAGLPAGGWVHEECPAWDTWVAGQNTPGDSLDQGEVIERELCVVRVSDVTTRRYWLLTCTDCVQQVILCEDEFDPTEEAYGEALASEQYAEAALAAYDDDPNPYSGTYSEM